MRHVVVRAPAQRLAAGYPLPGSPSVFCVVSDYPDTTAALGAATREADRLSIERRPELPPEERRIVPGFYADQGPLF